MKIDSISSLNVNKLNKIKNIDNIEKPMEKKSDSISISQDALKAHKNEQLNNNVKVNAIKSQIVNGTYKVNTNDLAKAIYKNVFEEQD